MCSKMDIDNKINLANVACNKFSKIWTKGKKVSSETKIKVYESTVVSVLTYNCGTWAVLKETLEKLDRFHRKHI